MGRRDAILEIAADRSALATGFLFALSAGLAREYDGEDLLHRPVFLLVPLVSSMFVAFLLYAIAYNYCQVQDGSRRFSQGFGAFLALFWMTAPLAWLYAIPYERFLSAEDAVRANLWTLGVVSIWRVALMIRVLMVILDYKGPQAFVLVMAVADSVAVALRFAVPVPLINIMGGLRLSPGDQVLAHTTNNVLALGGCSLPVWLILATIGRYHSAPAWRVPAAYSSWLAFRGGSARAVADGLLLLGVALLPIGQPEQIRRRQVEELFRAHDIPAALAMMSAHQPKDYPPHWNPPPRYTDLNPSNRSETEMLFAVWEHIDNGTAPWVREAYLDKLRNLLISACWFPDEVVLKRAAEIVQRLPDGVEFAQDYPEDGCSKSYIGGFFTDPRFREAWSAEKPQPRAAD
jgi:hypothetical protein